MIQTAPFFIKVVDFQEKQTGWITFGTVTNYNGTKDTENDVKVFIWKKQFPYPPKENDILQVVCNVLGKIVESPGKEPFFSLDMNTRMVSIENPKETEKQPDTPKTGKFPKRK